MIVYQIVGGRFYGKFITGSASQLKITFLCIIRIRMVAEDQTQKLVTNYYLQPMLVCEKWEERFPIIVITCWKEYMQFGPATQRSCKYCNYFVSFFEEFFMNLIQIHTGAKTQEVVISSIMCYRCPTIKYLLEPLIFLGFKPKYIGYIPTRELIHILQNLPHWAIAFGILLI